ncbi:MAG: T9SS type B sorting domain-containing protein [Bacteroidota bacterium]
MKKLLYLCVLLAFCSCERTRINQANREACRSPYLLAEIGDNLFVKAPNIFTPNGDNVNDALTITFPVFLSEITDFELEILDGTNVLFTSFNPDKPWLGDFNDRAVPVGNYDFTLQFTYEGQSFSFESEVAIIRPPFQDESRYILQNCNTCVFPDQFDVRGNDLFDTREPLGNICP